MPVVRGKDIEVLFSASTIARRNLELAKEIAANDYHDLLVISILKGSFIFAGDLIRAMHDVGLSPEVEFIFISSYGTGTTSGEVRVGDVLEAGKVVLTVAREQGFRVDVTVPDAEIGHLREGMEARIKLDAYNYQQYGTLEGTVCFISPDSGVAEGRQAAFYTVRVELGRDEVGRGSYRGRVKLGMAGQAEVVTGRDSLLSLLLKRIRQTISLG